MSKNTAHKMCECRAFLKKKKQYPIELGGQKKLLNTLDKVATFLDGKDVCVVDVLKAFIAKS